VILTLYDRNKKAPIARGFFIMGAEMLTYRNIKMQIKKDVSTPAKKVYSARI
jgi:hypothetical protein